MNRNNFTALCVLGFRDRTLPSILGVVVPLCTRASSTFGVPQRSIVVMHFILCSLICLHRGLNTTYSWFARTQLFLGQGAGQYSELRNPFLKQSAFSFISAVN